MIHITNTPYAMPYRERLNNVNEAKRITESFGYSDFFATLSLSLSQVLIANYTLLSIAGVRAMIYGFSCKLARRSDCFLPIHL